jgi:hypothetical protein
MSNRRTGLGAVAAGFLLLIGVVVVGSAVAPAAPRGAGALFGAFVQRGCARWVDSSPQTLEAFRVMGSGPYFNPPSSILPSPAPG